MSTTTKPDMTWHTEVIKHDFRGSLDDVVQMTREFIEAAEKDADWNAPTGHVWSVTLQGGGPIKPGGVQYWTVTFTRNLMSDPAPRSGR